MPLIETRGLTKLYRMGDSVVRALDGVDLSIDHGEFIAITGPSGSGKSTMMHLLGCLDRPTAGTYLFDGQDVSNFSDARLAEIRNRQIGFVFQTFNLINRTTAAENVAVPLFYARKTALQQPAGRALERVGLSARATHLPSELSGGERQRVAIARAIVNDPLLLMADEPTGNLDSRTGAQIMRIFRELNDQGVTIVMVTHEPEIAEQARRIVQMRDGKIVSDRLVDDILREEGRSRVRHAADAPEAELPPVEEGTAAEEQGAMPPRVPRGATASLVMGLIAAGLWAVSLGVQFVLQQMYDVQAIQAQAQQGKMPPAGMIVASLGSAGAILAALVLGVLAIVFGMGARKRMRREVGQWVGRWRMVVGMLLGVVAVGLPLVGVVVAIVQLAAGNSPMAP